MGAGACIRLTEPWAKQQWDYLLVSFGIARANVWARKGTVDGRNDPLPTSYPNAQVLTVEEIDWQGPIVVVQPENGRWVTGSTNIVDFVHPLEALYVFGGDTYWLSKEDLGQITIAHTIYIPTETNDDLYSFVAGGIVFYDRMIKNG